MSKAPCFFARDHVCGQIVPPISLGLPGCSSKVINAENKRVCQSYHPPKLSPALLREEEWVFFLCSTTFSKTPTLYVRDAMWRRDFLTKHEELPSTEALVY